MEKKSSQLPKWFNSLNKWLTSLKKSLSKAAGGSSEKLKPQEIEKILDDKEIKKITASKPRSSKLSNWKVMLPVALILTFLVWLGLRFNIDELVIASAALVFAILSGVFAWVVGIIALVPVIGPLVIKILSIPLVWLINGIGYLVSYTAIKRGYSKDVITYRGLTVTLIIGIVIGYIIANLIAD